MSTSNFTIRGTLLDLTSDSVRVAADGGSAVVIARRDVTAFGVSAGRSSRRKPTLWGALAGAALLGFVVFVAGEDCYPNPDPLSPTEEKCSGPSNATHLGGIALGALLGGGTGYFLIGGRERWQGVTLHRPDGGGGDRRLGLRVTIPL